MKTVRALFILLLISGAILAVLIVTPLGRGIVVPNVRVQYRQALLDPSRVAIIYNAGSRPLFDVSVSSQRWEKKYVVSSTLKPGDKADAGWLELPSGLRSNDVLEVYADGYYLPYRSRVP